MHTATLEYSSATLRSYAKAIREINRAQVLAYWEIGREIVEFEQRGKARAEYGEELIVRLAKDMIEKFGGGFSNRVFASKYKLTLPTEKELRAKLKPLPLLKSKSEREG